MTDIYNDEYPVLLIKLIILIKILLFKIFSIKIICE